MKTLRVILTDQLSVNISSLEDCSQSDIIFMCELLQEFNYVKHHKKKIAFLLSAMRHFADELAEQHYNIIYTYLDDVDNKQNLTKEVQRIVGKYAIEKIVITHPSEYRNLQEVHSWGSIMSINVEIRDDNRFLCSGNDFKKWSSKRQQLRMEYFYREMRKRHNILMQDDIPVGGNWNYDIENRKFPKTDLNIPQPYVCTPDSITSKVISLVEEKFSDHFGDLEPFYFACTRKQALAVLKQFIEQRLASFGDYQDAMLTNEPWMYHSHLSFYLNCGLLLPMECIKAAEDAYYANLVPLNAVEGFIRQIMGWREYIRGVYWLKMPEYAHENFFDAHNKLPQFYWHADTKMNCLSQCVKETKQNAYAHHIQRLMVLGNFALLAGISPVEVNEWFLIVYADAYEWVELPNVSGMILFADGGYLASKPYAAGGSYINKMSDYCKNCSYQVAAKTGDTACPFNYLYWDFIARNRDKLKSNHRMGMMYKTYDRMPMEKKDAIHADSLKFLSSLV